MWENPIQESKRIVMFNVLETKIFQYDFLEGHNVWQNNCLFYWLSTPGDMKSPANQYFWLPKILIMLVTLATVLVTILSPLFNSLSTSFYGWTTSSREEVKMCLKCVDIMSDHNVKLARRMYNSFGQCLMTDCYYLHCHG